MTKESFKQHSTVCVSCDEAHADTDTCSAGSELLIEPSYSSHDDALLGQVIDGKYRIEEQIGAGGMCQVYRATQILIGKTVALKLLRPQLAVDQQQVRRFEQEASALGRLRHPHAINVFDFGFTSQECPYLVMDFISGHSLNDLIRQTGPLPLARTNILLKQICSALQAAHSVGIIHRDIKPENILISATDGEDWVTVVDFGVAKLQEDIHQQTSLTGEGFIIGTPRYMSPEQSEGKPIDTRSDIYSLGVVLYEMLAGETPFTDNSAARLLIKHISEDPPPLREKRAELSEGIEHLVMRTLAKDPMARPATALALSKAFDHLIDECWSHGVGTQLIVPLAAKATENDEDSAGLAPVTKTRVKAPITSSPPGTMFFNPGAFRVSRVLVLCALGLALICGALYYFRPSSASLPVEQIIATQRTVTLASNQIIRLPAGHILRDQLPQLNEWQKDLGRYAILSTVSPDTQNRIQTMDQLAKHYADQAQLALAQATVENSETRKESITANPSALAPGTTGGNEEQDKLAVTQTESQSAREPGKTKGRVKGPNKFTQVIKKVFRIP